MTDAFIYDAIRSPRGKGRADGALHEVTAVALSAQILDQIRIRNGLEGHAVEGARVSVVGHDAEAVFTRSDGGFVLPAHVSATQTVRLHVEKEGFTPEELEHSVSGPALLRLGRP